MVRIPPGEEREIKVDILKMILYDDAIRPNEITFETIEDSIPHYEKETILRWVMELAEDPDCPLEFHSERKAAVCFEDRNQAELFIDDLESDPWYMPDLD